MRRNLLLIVWTVMALAATGPASAKRVRIPVPVPVEGSFEKIVKVQTLPDTPAFMLKGGIHFDLGYLSRNDGTGEWVGYVKSNTDYVPLGPESLDYIKENAGLQDMPPVPSVDHTGDMTGTFAAVGGAVVSALLLLVLTVRALRRRRSTVRIVLPKAESAAPQDDKNVKGEKSPNWVQNANAKVNATAQPIESAIIKQARERAARIAEMEPAQRGRIAKSPELMHRPAFGRR